MASASWLISIIPVQSEVLVDDYVANDINFSSETSRLAILTGPNMAGEFFILSTLHHTLIERTNDFDREDKSDTGCCFVPGDGPSRVICALRLGDPIGARFDLDVSEPRATRTFRY